MTTYVDKITFSINQNFFSFSTFNSHSHLPQFHKTGWFSAFPHEQAQHTGEMALLIFGSVSSPVVQRTPEENQKKSISFKKAWVIVVRSFFKSIKKEALPQVQTGLVSVLWHYVWLWEYPSVSSQQVGECSPVCDQMSHGKCSKSGRHHICWVI